MKTYGKLRWFSEWKPDLSNLGHALEAGLVSAVCAPVVVWGAGELAAKTARVPVFSLEDAFLLTSFGMLCWYIGREKRDCETGMDLPAGSPKAWLFMWWRPKNILFACLLFGFLDAFAIRYQGYAFPLIGKVPVQLMQALPYILTVILLAGFIGKAIPPKAGGVPYVKER